MVDHPHPHLCFACLEHARAEDVGVSATLSEEKIDSVEKYLELVFERKLIFAVGVRSNG